MSMQYEPKRDSSWNILMRVRTSAKLVRICKVSALAENLRHNGLHNRDLSVTQCTAEIARITSTLYCPLQGEPPCWQLASVGIKAASFRCRHQSIIGVVMCASEGELHPHSLQFHSIIQSNILSPSVNSLVRNSQCRPACLIPYRVIAYP